MVNKTTWRVHEIIEKASAAKTRADKIKILQDYQSNWALKDVLRGTFDEVVQWNLPEGKPPYEPALEQSVPSNLLKHNKKFAYFVKGGPGDRMPAFKREKMFIDILETIHPKDAELLLTMKDKKQPAKGITKKLVEEAFPGLILK
jgi:hypothetical protein